MSSISLQEFPSVLSNTNYEQYSMTREEREISDEESEEIDEILPKRPKFETRFNQKILKPVPIAQELQEAKALHGRVQRSHLEQKDSYSGSDSELPIGAESEESESVSEVQAHFIFKDADNEPQATATTTVIAELPPTFDVPEVKKPETPKVSTNSVKNRTTGATLSAPPSAPNRPNLRERLKIRLGLVRKPQAGASKNENKDR